MFRNAHSPGTYNTTYLLLAEFSVRTVNYGPSFSPRLSAWAINRWKKKRGSIIYSTDRKNEANKMFIICLLPVLGTGNKCRTRDLTGVKNKVFIGSRKQYTLKPHLHDRKFLARLG